MSKRSNRSNRSLALRGFVTERLSAAAEEIFALVERTGNEPSLKQEFQMTPQIKEEPEEESLRALVTERLSAAAEEICELVERTIAECEEEHRSKEENQRRQQLLEENQRRQQLLEENQRRQQLLEENQRRQQLQEEDQRRQQLQEENQRRQQLLEENQRRQQLLEENQRRQQLLEENQRRQQLQEENQRRQQLLEENQRRQQLLEEVLRLHTTQKTLQENREDPQIHDAPGCVEVKEEDPDELPIAMETGSESRLNEYIRKYMDACGGNDTEDEAQTWTLRNQSVSPKSRRDEAKSNYCHICKTHFPRLWQLKKHVDTHRGSFCQKVFPHKSSLKKRTTPHAEERPFPCDACEKTFPTRSSLTAHVKATHAQVVTPRVFVRNTDRTTYLESLKKAAEQHEKHGVSVRKAAANFGLSNSTLQRFIKQNEDGRANFGYQNCVTGLVFSNDMEKTLAEHIRELDHRFHGLTARKCRALAYEFARRNHLDKTPKGWEENRMAGEEWFEGFKKRHNLTCRKPEASSVAKSLAFNKTAVGEFFGKLKDVYERHHFSPQAVYNLDETGFTIEQSPGMVVSTPGKKLVGAVTAVCSINASGNALPPFYVFPSVQMKPTFLTGAIPGAAGAASESGWTSEVFSESYLPFFIAQTHCSPERPVLLIMDNHESHISLEAVSQAKASGIVIVTLPPHTSRRLQPLDRTVYGPMKTFFNRATASWMTMNNGRTISIEEIAALSGQAFTSAMTPSNILSGFKSTGICPLNPEVFTEQNFLPADVGDGPTPDDVGDGLLADNVVHEEVVSDHLMAVDESHFSPDVDVPSVSSELSSTPTQFVSSSVSDVRMIPSIASASTLQNSDPTLLWTDSTLHSHWEGWATSSQ